MRLIFARSRTPGLTHLELIMILGLVACIFFFFFFFILPVEQASKRHAQRAYCVNNLHRMDMAYQSWAADHNNKFPMSVSLTNGGAMELIATGNAAACFEIVSNGLFDPKILVCPADRIHRAATSFANGFDNSNISYFVSLDAAEASPQKLLFGDDNLEVSGVPVRPGLLQFSTNAPIAWGSGRHAVESIGFGNISLADGSVEERGTPGLRESIQYSVQGTSATTNRFAIP